jgi:protein-tyrosine phosphatase
MLSPELLDDWQAGRLVSVADTGRTPTATSSATRWQMSRNKPWGISISKYRPILAHPERCPELWHSHQTMVDWIRRGCLMQICADSVNCDDKPVHRQLQAWLARGWVHLVASDGHSLDARRPELSAAHDRIARWTNPAVAERLCSTNGMAILQGLPLVVPQPEPPKRRWFAARR